ncbi:MAG: PAS domain-containing sensor histidine kinase [Planctomycetaceae bacterium]|nr:MAG: PAS domain-containing sensor histidine kinase [Planctomycetaceae bacterium]
MPKPVTPALAQSANDDTHFRLVADSTYDWETWLSVDGRPLWVNPAVVRVTGRSPEECLAMPDYPLPLVEAEDRDKVAEIWSHVLGYTSGNDVEFRVRHLNGKTVWVAISWQPMVTQGERLGFRTSIRDITRKQMLREELRIHAEHLEDLVKQRTERLRSLERKQVQMEKLAALGQLAASVAHEINNPLAGIRNALTLIRSDQAEDHPHQEIFDLIDKEIDRMSGIVAQMYQSYRRQTSPAHRFDLGVVIREVLYFLTPLARDRQVRLENRCGTKPAPVELPEDEIKQVIYNLVRNAIQASPGGHLVEVHLADSSDHYRIDVTDQGTGISEQDLPAIFEPFFSTKGNDSGTGMGLGLSVSQAIIESLGGKIEVQTQVGRGSRFLAFIPRRLPAS